MKKLRLRTLGDPVLRKKARKLEKITPAVKETIDCMWDVMYESNGIGLAAPQVGLSQRIIVVDTREEDEKIALINPEITWYGPEICSMKEGCLSIPGVEGDVDRPLKIRVKGINQDGRAVEFEASDLYARVFQHEIDHLNGVVFVDRISELEAVRLKPSLEKFDDPVADKTAGRKPQIV